MKFTSANNLKQLHTNAWLKSLGREVAHPVHGEEASQRSPKYHWANSLQENIKTFLSKSSNKGLRENWDYQVQADENHNIVELLVSSAVNSKRQAREDVQNGAIYATVTASAKLDYVLSDADKLDRNELTVIRGKSTLYWLTKPFNIYL